MITSFGMDFVDTFMVLYNAGAAFILIFMIGQILIMMRKVDKELLRARLFLNNSIIQKTWIYISIAGASFALNNVFKFIINFTSEGYFLNVYHMADIAQLVFLVSFILAVQNWYEFIGSFSARKSIPGKYSVSN
ncbi:MAG: hypothetical protein WA144_06215 [Candidatus Methanoperedens sp.]